MVWITSATGYAQDTSAKFNFLDFSVGLVSPQRTFGKSFGDGFFNLDLAYHRQISLEKPVFWGIGIGYSKFGSVYGTFEETIDLSFEEVSYSTYNNLVNFRGGFRYYPDLFFGRFYPYIEGELGGAWIFTTTDRTITALETSESDINFGRIAPSMGGTIGLNIEIVDSWYLSLGYTIFKSLPIRYLYPDDNAVQLDSTLDVFKERRSTVDANIFRIGITMRWDRYTNFEE